MPTNAITPIVVLTEAVLKTIEEYNADRILYFTLQGDSDSQIDKFTGAGFAIAYTAEPDPWT